MVAIGELQRERERARGGEEERELQRVGKRERKREKESGGKEELFSAVAGSDGAISKYYASQATINTCSAISSFV